MSKDDGSNMFISERFRYNREKLIETAEKFLENIKNQQSTYDTAIKAYRKALHDYALQNYESVEPQVSTSYGNVIEVTFRLRPDERRWEQIGTEPERPRGNLQNLISEIEKALIPIKLGDGQYVPAKMAETVTKLLVM